MRYQQYLTEKRLSDFIEMIREYFQAFADDVKRLGKDTLKPWVSRAEVNRMKRDGWKIEKHSSHQYHELWLMVKGDEEKIVGY